MPLRPPQSWDPETMKPMSFHCTPASFIASSMASFAIAVHGLSGNLPQGWSPTPMIATSFILFSPFRFRVWCCRQLADPRWGSDGLELPGDDVFVLLVRIE